MSTIERRVRGVCTQCGERCKVVPTQFQWFESRGPHRGWLWTTRVFCPGCRLALKQLLFAPEKRAMAQGDTERPLVVLLQRDGPQLLPAELTTDDVADLATVRAWTPRFVETAS